MKASAYCFCLVLCAMVFGLQCKSFEKQASDTETDSWHFDPRHVEHVELPPMVSDIKRDPNAHNMLRALWDEARRFNSDPARQYVRFPAWQSRKYVQGLVKIVVEHPDTTPALTARFELGSLLARAESPDTRRYGEMLLLQVEARTDTWQGVLARLRRVRQQIQTQELAGDVELEVANLNPKLKDLEENLPEDLIEWSEHLWARPNYEYRASLLNTIINSCLKRDDRDLAAAYAKKVLEHYPDSRYARFARDTLLLLSEGFNPYKPPPMKW